MPEAPGLESTLASLAVALRSARIPHMLVGGLAVLVHGAPRFTRDIDVTVDLAGAGVSRLLAALPHGFRPLVADPEAFARSTNVVPVEGPDGTRVDLIVAALPFELDAIRRARLERLGAAEIAVCSPEDLILHKVVSDRPQDRADVESVVRAQRATLDRERLDRTIRALAEDLERPEMLERWLSLFR